MAEIERLESEYADELVVVGVHSPKFSREADTGSLSQFLSRYEVDHPTVNDVAFETWTAWDVSAWPTAVLIDPTGNIVARHAGLGTAEAMGPIIDDLAGQYDDGLDRTIRVFPTPVAAPPPTVLSFPEAVLADPAANRLFIADTNHHRIVVADLTTGDVETVIGTGTAGRDDGAYDDVTFDEPAGMALSPDGGTLYVADRNNHLLRAVDLERATVVTVAGTGNRGTLPAERGAALRTDLNTPADITSVGDVFAVSMAGFNQVWVFDPVGGTVEPVAGTGRQGVVNGATEEAELAGPAGLASVDGRVYLADSQSSAIRYVGIDATDATVDLVAGSDLNLFDFGDEDGIGAAARFQRPLGIDIEDGMAWIADTYNSKIKRLNLVSGQVTTVAGSVAGWKDGIDALFAEPAGIDVAAGKVYVADTGNHSIRVLDVSTAETSTFILKGIERLVPDEGGDEFAGTLISADPVVVGAGPGRVVLDVGFPDGYKANDLAPSNFVWTSEGGVVALAPTADGEIVGPTFPIEIEATFAPGSGTLRADLWLVFCETTAQSICLFDRARIEVPIEVSGQGASTLEVAYEVLLPEVR